MTAPAPSPTVDMRDVWFQFINSEASAIPTTLDRLSASDADSEALVFRPGAGLAGWTPVHEVLSTRAGSSTTVGTEPEADSPNVTNVQHGVSVRIDPKTGGLRGLPEGWTGLLPEGCASEVRADANLPPELRPTTRPRERLTDGPLIGQPYNVKNWRPQFGLPLEVCETTPVNGYEIPSILVHLWATLRTNGGLREEGIFRLAPDALACETLREALCSCAEGLDRVNASTDAHVLANLIKIFFRMLPSRLLEIITPEQIASCEGGKEAMGLLKSLPAATQGLLLWLLELMAEVVGQSEHNRMNERAIAVVLAPNLYEPPELGEAARAEDPMAALAFTQGMARFVTDLLLHYMAVRRRVSTVATAVRVSRGSTTTAPADEAAPIS